MGEDVDKFKAAMEKYPPYPGGAKPPGYEAIVPLALIEVIERLEKLEKSMPFKEFKELPRGES